MSLALRQSWVALRLLLLMTLIVGVAYPILMFGVGRLVSGTSDGSYVTDASGAVVGSALIGQQFAGDEWFWPRPSAAGEGYDALRSSGSNLAADNPDLVTAVGERQAVAAAADGVRPQDVPADAVTASGSGLDPDISPEYARQQVGRVAAARGLDPARVLVLVDEATQGRMLGFIGEPRVSVLQLNLALEDLG